MEKQTITDIRQRKSFTHLLGKKCLDAVEQSTTSFPETYRYPFNLLLRFVSGTIDFACECVGKYRILTWPVL